LQKLAIAIAAIATLASTSVFAADMPVNAPPATVWSWSGFYIGAGGSFNWTRFDQALQGVSGIQTITIGQDEVALVPNFTEARVKTITAIPESLESLERQSLGSRASDSGY